MVAVSRELVLEQNLKEAPLGFRLRRRLEEYAHLARVRGASVAHARIH